MGISSDVLVSSRRGLYHRHCERSEAIHSRSKRKMDCFASFAMTSKHTFAISRRDALEALMNPSPLRGRGECRMPAAPAVSCACCSGRTHTSNNEDTGITRHSRTQWFYGLCRALPGDRALCHRHPRTDVVPKPGRADITSANLTPTSGRQDHTILPSAATSLVSVPVIAHKSFDSPCDPIARKTLPRPPHPVPYVRDDRETPLCVGRDAQGSRCDLGGVKT